MVRNSFKFLALALVTTPHNALAQSAGSITEVGSTLVSAMMMFLGNAEKLYILDKAEGNAETVNGKPAWASVWDLNSNSATVMDMETNPFCAAGMHLPNGSFATFGGNGAITVGGNVGSNSTGGSASYDTTYQDYDGTKAIRIINPCTSDISSTDMNTNCTWYDSPEGLQMQKHRWYPGCEPLADGSVVLVGGFTNGGYINRNTPNKDPEYEGGAAEPTYEIYPSNFSGDPQVMQFMITTSGLNSYAHTYLMPSGKMFVQANFSTILWNYTSNEETALPDMPGKVVRVYPASGAVAMLPLTPANDYTPTILFCGGSDIEEQNWGNYSWPAIDTFYYPASTDCQRITPEPTDGSGPEYVQDDDLPVGRTMGQFIALPDGKLLVINGGENGTAGYATQTGTTLSYSEMPYGMSLAAAPVLQPAIYDPNADSGSRWSTEGLSSSTIPRLYHSSAMLLPDGSVFIAGSNPNVDVNLTTFFPTTYKAEIFYPPYFSATTRPSPTGIPSRLSYGGDYFDVAIPASSYSGTANDAADNTTVWLMRGGFTTHAMNMGQRAVQLNNTYEVQSNGSILLHVSQPPPNANLFQPGPGYVYVTVNGIPSNGSYVIVGSGAFGTQPTANQATLPASVRLDSASGTADGSSTGESTDSGTSTGAIIGGIVGGIAAVGILGAAFGIYLAKRRRAAAAANSQGYPMRSTSTNANVGVGNLGYGADAAAAGVGAGYGASRAGARTSDSSAFVPLQANMSTASLNSPYQDHFGDESRSGTPMSHYGARDGEYDPYYDNNQPRMSTSAGPPRF